MNDAPLRRCIGSKTFGIEPHDAPISDFPTQPSQKDGLGRMCHAHWTAYTGALRKAALAKKAAQAAATEPAPAADGDAPIAPFSLAKGPDGEPVIVPVAEAKPARAPRAAKPAKTNALLATIERLGGTEYTDAIGSDEAQAALEVVNGAGLETPLGETIDAGTEEADALIVG